jgi:hypothetical protein
MVKRADRPECRLANVSMGWSNGGGGAPDALHGGWGGGRNLLKVQHSDEC